MPSPAPSGPTGKVVTLSFLHPRFACGVAADEDLPPIWESVARGRGKMDGLATLNQALMRGMRRKFPTKNMRSMRSWNWTIGR